MHALAREPRFRPASAAEFAHELAGSTELPTERLLASAGTEPLGTRRYRGIPGWSGWLWIAAAAVVAAVASIIGLAKIGGGGGKSSRQQLPPARVAPPVRGGNATEEAQNLARWIRAHSR